VRNAFGDKRLALIPIAQYLGFKTLENAMRLVASVL
jgi:hypothetical protein